jgi:hypothetical protein
MKWFSFTNHPMRICRFRDFATQHNGGEKDILLIFSIVEVENMLYCTQELFLGISGIWRTVNKPFVSAEFPLGFFSCLTFETASLLTRLIQFSQQTLNTFLHIFLGFIFNPLKDRGLLLSLKSECKNIGNFTNLLKPHNIGTHLKGIETSFQVVPLFLKSFHFWASCITF